MYVDIVYTLVSYQDNDGSGWMAIERANDVGHRRPHRRPRDFSARLVDDGDEIRERFVAHGRIWPMCRRARRARSSPRPIAMSMTRQTVAVCGDELATAPSLNLSRSLRRVSRGGEVAFADLGAGVGDGCPNVGKIADRRGKNRAGHEPAGHIGCDEAPPTHSRAA
jgi:hypothetical protein